MSTLPFPNEILFQIFRLLGRKDIVRFGVTCKANYNVLMGIRASGEEEVDDSCFLEKFRKDVFGRKQGRFSVTYFSGDSLIETYVDGKRHGPCWETNKKGTLHGHYVNGERCGKWYGVTADGKTEICKRYKHGVEKIVEERDEKGTLSLWVEKFGRGMDVQDDEGIWYHETVEFLFERTEWNIVCGKKKCPTFQMYNAGDNYQSTKANRRVYAFCCKKHQRQMPDSLF
ncbi:F-box containing protein [Tunisvirus fontaine2]|uniref:F-box containing protein n=1 Tax=Tunisvirus fontaine2 TaxID=1421067 RepID=V9SGH8_9VIRU|nr:F-box containing protein [Tunisvirus fontaine2]AHC54994.1 F-box containing protein [Tunisvirus fontaine2]